MRGGLFLVLSAALLLGGCASGPNAHPQDPMEPLNRSVSKFNTVVDDAAIKPVAQAYRDHMPSPVQTGVNNFFANLQDVWSAFNNLFQLKPKEAGESVARVAVNSTIGLLGVLDVASTLKLEKHTEDFGQTLGYWGVPSGPYVVLPLLGPSTVRDAIAYVGVDAQADLVNQIDPVSARNVTAVVRVVDKRAGYLEAEKRMGEVALDKYTFMRDIYLQKRRSEVWDGNPPETDDGGLPWRQRSAP